VPWIALCAILAGCDAPEAGGVTARLVFPLTARGVPVEIDRLIISAHDVGGSTLSETILALQPAEGEQLLVPEGGTWALDEVPIGADRIIQGRGFFGAVAEPSLIGALALRGQRSEVLVLPGRTTNIGPIVLEPVPGARLPSIDFESPGAPAPLTVVPTASGEGLTVEFVHPGDSDLAGYLVAVTSTIGIAPRIDRAAIIPEPGIPISGGAMIKAVVRQAEPTPVRIDGLENDLLHVVLVYSYDTDFSGAALNFSGAAESLIFPTDSEPPGAVTDLLVELDSAATVAISFTAAGEDGTEGLPARYELRAANNEPTLLDPSAFIDLPIVAPPPVQAPGTMTRIVRTLEELGATQSSPLFIGLRAIDASGNRGAIAVAPWSGGAALAPAVEGFRPEIGLAGSTLDIEGIRFGAAVGSVELASASSTRSFSLPVVSWDEERVTVALPPESESGRLSIIRADAQSNDRFLPLLSRLGVVPQGAGPIFAAINTSGIAGGDQMATYTGKEEGGVYRHAVERYGDPTQPDRVLEQLFSEPMTAVAGTYSAEADRFLFIASTAATETMTAVVFSPSGPGSRAVRIDGSVRTGNADSIAIEILEGATPQRIPALIAFSSNGVVRTATVVNVGAQPFQRFVVVSEANERADLVSLARRTDPAQPDQSPVLMAYRQGGSTAGELVLRDALGDGGAIGAFALRPPAQRPAVAERVEVLDVPGHGFVIAYEERLAGRTEVRLLRAEDYGTGPGYAPFVDDGRSRGLEDVGLIMREGEVWIALAIKRPPQSLGQLNYVEVSAAELTSDGRGVHQGTDLDFADASARLACRPRPSDTCGLFWLGEQNPQILYLRR
jgi:hypothetical protein